MYARAERAESTSFPLLRAPAEPHPPPTPRPPTLGLDGCKRVHGENMLLMCNLECWIRWQGGAPHARRQAPARFAAAMAGPHRGLLRISSPRSRTPELGATVLLKCVSA